MKVFYSWQLDAPRKINKDFIYSALEDAISKITEETDLTQAERDGIELDQDTQGVLGSPEISRVIFEKIAVSHVVVADVSLVAEGNARKKHLNSNVAIELGYAYGKLGDGAVLKVMNTHFGGPDSLPFDLRIRRHPVQYNLAPDADSETKAAEKKRLAGALAQILRQYAASGARTTYQEHEETPIVGMRARFWGADEVLIPREDRYKVPDLYLKNTRLLYCRFIPTVALPNLTAKEAYDLMTDVQPLVSFSGWSRTRNRWGVISFDRSADGTALVGATQLFRNREIWGIDPTFSESETDPERSSDSSSTPRKIIPTGAIQREYPRSIDSMRTLAGRLGFGDQYIVEMGYSGAEGSYLTRGRQYFNPFVGPFYDQDVYIRKKVSIDYPTGAIMNDFWEKLFSEVGSQVPDELTTRTSE